MILTKKVKIKVSKQNLKHYRTFDSNIKISDEIEIDVEKLKKFSDIIVKVKCDICEKEKEMTYSIYNQNCDRNNNLYCCYDCRTSRTIQTNLKKYGVENVSQADDIKEKKKETNLKNWGVENVYESEKIKNKIKKTKKEKYGDECFNNRDKSKETCLKNNGVEWPTQSEKILKKRNENNKNKFGFEHYPQTEECKNKITKTCLEKYGKETFLGSEECKIKSIKTCREKYGVDYPSQNYEIHKKQFPKLKMHDIGIKYQGSYEKDFLDLCQKLNLNVERGKTLHYKLDGNNKIYFSDFYLKNFNLIIEIKSTYIFELHKNTNSLKENAAINSGYNFLFIIDKNYKKFLKIIN